jgi:hypothetical protein
VRLSAIDSGFHVVPAGLGQTDPDADGDSVTNVRFSEGPDTKIATIKLRGSAIRQCPPREFPGRGVAHGKQALARNAGPLTPGLLTLTITAVPYSAAGFNTTNGTQLVLWTCNSGTNQHWTVP